MSNRALNFKLLHFRNGWTQQVLSNNDLNPMGMSSRNLIRSRLLFSNFASNKISCKAGTRQGVWSDTPSSALFRPRPEYNPHSYKWWLARHTNDDVACMEPPCLSDGMAVNPRRPGEESHRMRPCLYTLFVGFAKASNWSLWEAGCWKRWTFGLILRDS